MPDLAAGGPAKVDSITYVADKGDGVMARYIHKFERPPKASIRSGRMSFPVDTEINAGHKQVPTKWLINPISRHGSRAEYRHRRLESPSHFKPGSFRTIHPHGRPDVSIIVGKLKGSRKMTAQAVLIPKGNPYRIYATGAGPFLTSSPAKAYGIAHQLMREGRTTSIVLLRKVEPSGVIRIPTVLLGKDEPSGVIRIPTKTNRSGRSRRKTRSTRANPPEGGFMAGRKRAGRSRTPSRRVVQRKGRKRVVSRSNPFIMGEYLPAVRENMPLRDNPHRRHRHNPIRRLVQRFNPGGKLGRWLGRGIAVAAGVGVYFLTDWGLSKVNFFATVHPSWKHAATIGVGVAVGIVTHLIFHSWLLGALVALPAVAMGAYQAYKAHAEMKKTLAAPKGAATVTPITQGAQGFEENQLAGLPDGTIFESNGVQYQIQQSSVAGTNDAISGGYSLTNYLPRVSDFQLRNEITGFPVVSRPSVGGFPIVSRSR